MKWTAMTLATGSLLTGCLVAVDGSYPPDNRGNGILVEETRLPGYFRALEIHGKVEVFAEEGPRYQVAVTADENLLPYFTTSVRGDRLVLDWSASVRPTTTPRVVVTAPDLETVRHYGRSRVEVEQSTWRRKVLLETYGSGSIHYIGAANRVTAASRGGGGIEMLGYADVLEARTESAGDVLADGFLAGDAFAEVVGFGDITLSLDQGAWLTARILGSGDVEWWGWPAKTIYDLQGSGRVIEHRALAKRSLDQAQKFKALKPAAP